MSSISCIAIIFSVYALGDFVAKKSKAVISMLVFAMIAYAILFWMDILPATVFSDSRMLDLGQAMIGMLLVHLGSMINMEQLILEWKTVMISFLSCVGIAAGVYLLAGLFIDRSYAIAAAPVLCGGNVAMLMMSAAATEAGYSQASIFAMLVLALQSIIGIPLASLCCRSEARDHLSADIRPTKANTASMKQRKWLCRGIPKAYTTNNVILLKVAVIAFAASKISALTNDKVNHLILCLIFGCVLRTVGLLEENALVKANAFSLVISCTMLNVLSTLSRSKPQMILPMIGPLIFVFLFGIVACGIIAILVGKLLQYRWKMSVAIGLCALFGFPATYIISDEVAKVVGQTPEEQTLLLDYIMPKMVVGGFVSVSITSALIAGIFNQWF